MKLGIAIAVCVFLVLLALDTEALLRLAFASLPGHGIYRWITLVALLAIAAWLLWRRRGRPAARSSARPARAGRTAGPKRAPAAGRQPRRRQASGARGRR
ncbi:MAG: hypothetical protein WDN25_25155 [Acetobacteraceae bacterium]